MNWEGVAAHGKNKAMPVGFCASETQGTWLYALKLWGLWCSPLYGSGKLKGINRAEDLAPQVSFFSSDLKTQNHSSSYSSSEALLAIKRRWLLDYVRRFCEEKDRYDRSGHFWEAKALNGFPEHPSLLLREGISTCPGSWKDMWRFERGRQMHCRV